MQDQSPEVDPVPRPSPLGTAHHPYKVRPPRRLDTEIVPRERQRKQPELQMVVIETTQAGARVNLICRNRKPRQQVRVAIHSDYVRRRMMQYHVLVPPIGSRQT